MKPAVTTALDYFYTLPPGTMLTKFGIAPCLVKLANQWQDYRVNEDYVLDTRTGRIHYVEDFLTNAMSAKQFLRQWIIQLPDLAEWERQLLDQEQLDRERELTVSKTAELLVKKRFPCR